MSTESTSKDTEPTRPTDEAEKQNGSPKTIARVESGQDDRSINAFSSNEDFALAQRMAIAMSKATILPAEYQNNISNVMIAMEMANRIGTSVMAVMQNLDVIHGRPALRATFLIATVNTCGEFSKLRYRFEGKQGTMEWGCRAVAKDLKTDEELVGTLITIGTAHAEGWVDKKGSKWKTIPEQMLRYRAAAFWQRAYAPELSLGMHTSDELADGVPYIEPTVVQVSQRPTEGGLLGQLGVQPSVASQASE